MANPRLSIEQLMLAKLAAIGPANGDVVPTPIWQTSTRQIPLDQVPPSLRPTIILLTEEGASTFVGLGGVQDTTMRVAILLYLSVASIDDGQTVCNQYATALRHCLAVNRDWGGLAYVTEITEVPTHQLLTLPDAIVTVNADVRYRHLDSDAA